MDVRYLYGELDRDFILPYCSDNWSEISFNEYYTEGFQRTYMGLVLDNAEEIKSVYTAVFPSESVLARLFETGVSDALLFTHHPMAWDISNTPVFTDINRENLIEMKRRRIAMYNLHVPLDRNGYYSTSVNLAKAVGCSDVTGEFAEYYGCMVGAYASCSVSNVNRLREILEAVIGHEAKLYHYGDKAIKNGEVAFAAGGGNEPEYYEILSQRGVNTLVTGIASMRTGYLPSIQAHENAKKYGVNIIAGTHYSTEKFACMRMLEYFQKHGLNSEFIGDDPCMEDM